MTRPSPPIAHADDAAPRLAEVLRHLLAAAAVLVLLVPALRGHLVMIGWAPLWLLGAPALALAALQLTRRPPATRAAPAARPALAPSRRRAPQARRRHRPGRTGGLPRAA